MHKQMFKGFAAFDGGELLGAADTIDGLMTLIRNKIEEDDLSEEGSESKLDLVIERTTLVINGDDTETTLAGSNLDTNEKE